MISDFHIHTEFSGDSDTTMEHMIEQAIRIGLPSICITEHHDIDYPMTPNTMVCDIPAYEKKIRVLKEQYQDEIKVLFGIELGLQPYLAGEYETIICGYPFDFVIGSSHVVEGCDPYYPEYFENHTEDEAYELYFMSIIENIRAFSNIDVYGHIDYVVRYGPNKNRYYSYEKFQDVIDQILKICIEKGIGLEVNTGGVAYGLGFSHPHPDILKRYLSLGGEIITIGSDAHKIDRLGFGFDQTKEMLKECGFRYYSVFEQRQVEFMKI